MRPWIQSGPCCGGGGPLYGRFHRQHRLHPFTYCRAAELAPFDDLRDRAITYGVVGGTPRCLAVSDTKRPLAQNIQHLLLAPTGGVRTLVETALDQEEGLRDVATYRSILRAVAQGRTLRNEIADLAGFEHHYGLRVMLDRLIELGYLEARQNIDAKASDPVRYYVADPAFRFYQRLVEPNRSILERYGPDRVWARAVEPQLDTYMLHEFERIFQQAYDRLAPRRDLPLVDTWGRWEGQDRNRESLGIDIVAPLVGGGIMTGSIKWNREPIGPDVHWAHLAMLERASKAGRAWAHQGLRDDSPLLYVASGGFTPAFQETIEEADPPIALWNLDDSYQS